MFHSPCTCPGDALEPRGELLHDCDELLVVSPQGLMTVQQLGVLLADSLGIRIPGDDLEVKVPRRGVPVFAPARCQHHLDEPGVELVSLAELIQVLAQVPSEPAPRCLLNREFNENCTKFTNYARAEGGTPETVP